MSAVRSILRGVPGLEDAEISNRLTGGETSAKWLLKAGERKFVIRIDRPAAGMLGLDRQAEAEILKIVGEADIGPRLVWADPPNGIQVCTYVEGAAWTANDIHDPARLSKLARTLARLHHLPPVGPRFDPAGAAARYAAELATAEADELANRAVALAAELFAETDHPALCHNDLVHTNIVGEGPVRLIDWEYAGVGDAYFDLAVVIGHHELSRTSSDRFLEEYGRAAQPVNRERLGKFCRLYDQLAALWYLSLIQEAGPDSAFQSEWERISLRLNGGRSYRY